MADKGYDMVVQEGLLRKGSLPSVCMDWRPLDRVLPRTCLDC